MPEVVMQVATFAISCAVLAFFCWLAWAIWREGWRPFAFVLAVAFWRRLSFYVQWLRFSWSRRGDPRD